MKMKFAGIAIAIAATVGGSSVAAASPPKPKVVMSRFITRVCEVSVNGTRAEFLAAPKGQQRELLSIERYCEKIEIASNVWPPRGS
jgi:hypothetical protein